MKPKRIKIEITNRVNGMLEQGGVCGRIVSYPQSLVLEVLEITEDELGDYETAEDLADAIVPGIYCTLVEYLTIHYPDQCHVIRKGVEIQ